MNGLLNTPEGILRPETSIRPLIAIVSKRQTEKIFIAELDEITDSKKLINHFINKNSVNLQEGLFLPKEDFNGFEKYKIAKQLDNLLKQYERFKKYYMKRN